MFDLSPLLAYETGIHLGDGNLTYNKSWNLYRTTYAGNKIKDKDLFLKLLPKILFKLYGKKPRIYFPKNENTVLVVLNSKKISKFKMKLGLCSGNKLQIESFPKAIMEKFPELLLRGIADTDFSLNFRDKNKDGIKEYPRIDGCFNNLVFVEEISKILDKFGIKYSKSEIITHGKYKEYRIRVEGFKQFKNWLLFIGFSNPKHIGKIKLYAPLYLKYNSNNIFFFS